MGIFAKPSNQPNNDYVKTIVGLEDEFRKLDAEKGLPTPNQQAAEEDREPVFVSDFDSMLELLTPPGGPTPPVYKMVPYVGFYGFGSLPLLHIGAQLIEKLRNKPHQ